MHNHDNPKGFNEATLQVIDLLGGDRRTGKCFCPCHDDGENPSLQVGSGDKVPVVIHCFGRNSREHDQEVLDYLRAEGIMPTSNALVREQSSEQAEQARSPEDRRLFAAKIWRGLRDSGEEFRSLLASYLNGRGIKEVPTTARATMPPEYLACEDSEQAMSHDPGIVLPVRDEKGEFQGLHVIWLNPAMTAKCDTGLQRQSYGLIKGNFVQLTDVDWDHPPDTLLIGEGVETTLAAMQVTELPGIATAGAGMMQHLNPPRCRQYIILADNGEAGQQAASVLASRLLSKYPDCAVHTATPQRPEGGKKGYDWNDALMDAGSDGASIAEMRRAIFEAPLFQPGESKLTAVTGEGDDPDARITELAKLNLLTYEQQRDAAHKQMGIRAMVLDKLVEKRRAELAQASESGFLQPVEPWDEPVSGEALLQELTEMLNRHMVLPKHTDTAIVLWILHAHAQDAARHSPILFISSPTKRCGKTNLLELLGRVVPKPLSAANVTPATIFRAIERWKPTMLIDETDTFLADKSELRGVLNSGHTRSQAYVIRCVGDESVPTQFSTWCPKAFAAIGRMHPTLEDRSITIGLRRKLPTEKVSRIPKSDDAYLDIHRCCARWAADNLEVRSASPTIPTELNDRARDNWEPLSAIAEACGGDWPKRAHDAAIHLSAVDDDQTYSIQLLEDLRFLFEDRGKNLSTKKIVQDLEEMEDRPWPEFNRGQPITPRGVAKLLEPFGVKPRQVVVGEQRVQGYRLDQFKSVFTRYLPGAQGGGGRPSAPPETRAKSNGYREIYRLHESAGAWEEKST